MSGRTWRRLSARVRAEGWLVLGAGIGGVEDPWPWPWPWPYEAKRRVRKNAEATSEAPEQVWRRRMRTADDRQFGRWGLRSAPGPGPRPVKVCVRLTVLLMAGRSCLSTAIELTWRWLAQGARPGRGLLRLINQVPPV